MDQRAQEVLKVTIKMNDEFLSKNLRILFNDKSSIGLDRGGDIRAFPFGESHIYAAFRGISKC